MFGAWQLTAGQMRAIKVMAFLACTVPAVNMTYNAFWGDLGVNPVETLQHLSGEGAFAILICSLWVTPLRRITGQNRLQGLRRMLGLWAFFYAFVHFLFYLLLDQACLNWSDCQLKAVVDDVMKRKFILAGMVAFLTPSYFKSVECKEEINMARLRHKRQDQTFLFPLYVRSLENDAELPL